MGRTDYVSRDLSTVLPGEIDRNRTDYVSGDLSTVLPGEIDRNRTSDCRIILYLNLYF